MKEEILIKFLNDECSPQEIDQIRNWLKQDDLKVDKEFEAILVTSWNKVHEIQDLTEDRRRLLFTIHQRLEGGRKTGGRSGVFFSRRLDVNYVLKVAASVLIALSAVVFTIFKLSEERPEQTAGVETGMNLLATATGEKKEFQFSDGTRIFLNSASSIEFPDRFSGAVRKVKLKGEAFFEVAHQADRSFKVISGGTETTVLGTKFNVKEGQDGVEVTLAEGKVLVGLTNARAETPVELAPGEMASSDRNAQKIKIQRVKVGDMIAWKEGVIAFKNLPFEKVIEKLETWYGVNIAVSENIDMKRKINGEFNNDNLENILSGLSFSLEFDFSISGNHVTIQKY